MATIVHYVMEPSYVSESLRFFQDLIRYNLPQIPGRDIATTSYVLVNAFVGLLNNMLIVKPESIHDPAIIQEASQLFLKYLNLKTPFLNDDCPLC